MVVVRDSMGRVYLERRPPTGIWGGLWSLPEFDDESGLTDWCLSRGIAAETLERLSVRRHTFTHFHLNYRPVLVTEELGPRVEESGSARWWFTGSELALPSPIRQLLDELQ
jgi:A/G-specific adenine glycosylase